MTAEIRGGDLKPYRIQALSPVIEETRDVQISDAEDNKAALRAL